jgi:hypothetical protein
MILPVIIPLGKGYKTVDIYQNIDFKIYIIEDICEAVNKREKIAHTKNRCKDFALTLHSDFVVFNDSDLKHLYETNFEEMMQFFKNNKEYGAVSLLRDRVKNHVCNGVTMFKYEALKVIDFGNSPYLPTCHCLFESLKKANFKFDYLDDKIRIEEIKE